MTAEEAGNKWCPMIRFIVWNDFVLTNRGDKFDDEPEALCISDACMAWQWADDGHLGEGVRETTGYCGLAGRPK